MVQENGWLLRMVKIDIFIIFFISYTIKGRRKISPIKDIWICPYFLFSQLIWSINFSISYFRGKTFHQTEWLASCHSVWTLFFCIENNTDNHSGNNLGKTVNSVQLCFPFTAALYCTWAEVHRSFNKCMPRELINHVPNSTTVIVRYFSLL